MPSIATKDGVEIYYKDWGKGQPIVFSHGWPLSADDWDAQMLFFLKASHRGSSDCDVTHRDPAVQVMSFYCALRGERMD